MVIDLSDARWRKSARSGGQEACVEITDLPAAVAVRDSKDPEGPKLVFSRSTWRRFATEVKHRNR